MNGFRNISITQKLSILVGGLLVLTIILSIFSIGKMQKIADELETIAHDNLPLSKLMTGMTIHQLEGAVLLERLFRAAQIPSLDNEQERRQHERGLRELTKSFKQEYAQSAQLLNAAIDHAITEDLRNYLIALRQDLSDIEKEHLQFEKQLERVLQMTNSASRPEELSHSAHELEQLQLALDKHLVDVLDKIDGATARSVLVTEQEEKSALRGMIYFALFGLVFGTLLSLVFSKQIIGAINSARNLAVQMAAGNFSQRVKVTSGDELGQLLLSMNAMADALSQIVCEVRDRSNTIASTVTQLAALAETNKRCVEQQQMNTEQVASAITEMAATITEVASSAEESSISTTRAQENANKSCDVLSQTQAVSGQLVINAQKSQQMIAELESSTKQIESFVLVVEGISEQTNLLALNAAIEAARAGEQGRGFAVVADEVRALASRSQKATHEIKGLIQTLVERAQGATQMIDSSDQQIEESFSSITAAKNQLDMINMALVELTEANVQVAAASEEQSAVANQISHNMTDIRDAGETVLLSANETAQASEDLAEQAQGLKLLVSRFVI
ncbi:methyl-accepting chemotaxis protein [Vibrio cholerae]|uniref:methyl-accepting chemotaxis protein n=1 Tax=Vibrio cholerae TaxID=666 RepID=UPI00115B2D37|nr:methyl-accepting chemotaxis protein [Vibrio cholerae]TQQ56280.1 methyl-accepting chemotaxis protein [Vibrio cholerae]